MGIELTFQHENRLTNVLMKFFPRLMFLVAEIYSVAFVGIAGVAPSGD